MIAFVEGHVLLIEAGSAVIKTGGIGYLIMLSKKDLESIVTGQCVSLYVHSNIREDAFDLYGFISSQDKQLFQMLISVSGVGPKLALAIVSLLVSHELVSAITNKDLTKLSSIPGIGKKTAERLCLELKDKVQKLDLSFAHCNEEPPHALSLAQAIRGLGYSKDQSDRALAALAHDDLAQLPLEVLVKKTLAILTGKKPHDHS